MRAYAGRAACCVRLATAMLALSLSLALAGCAVAPDAPAIAPPAFAGEPGAIELPEAGQFLALDEDMRRFVRERLARVRDPQERLRRLTLLLLEDTERGVRYEADLTLAARDVFHLRAGNCLSFSALLVALAREARLDVRFQDVPVLPNWRLSGDAFLVERHVNALARIRGREFVIDFRPPDAASWNRASTITDANAIAQYFGNLGVERLTAGDLGAAYLLFRRGLEADPRATSLWINLGVVLGRNGQTADAQASYRQALALDPGNLSALSNLAGLAEMRGDMDAARELAARIERYRGKNPYFLYASGERLLRNGEPGRAFEMLQKAVRAVPEEAEFHFALARTQLALGREAQADASLGEALRKAVSESQRQRFRDLYAAGAPD